MDVRLPDGLVVQNVPDGISQADLVVKLKANGYDTSWYKPAAPDRFSEEAMTERTKTAVGSAAAIPETAAAMGSGIVASVFGGLAGLGAAPFVGADKAADIVRRIQGGMTYQPRSEAGRAVTAAAAAPFEMANRGLGMIGGAAGEAVGGEKGRFAGEAIGESVVPVLGTLAGYKPMVNAANAVAQSRQVANASKIIEQTQQNLPKIDAAKDAQRLGLVIDPSEVNPTFKNKALTTWAGRKQTDIRASELNLPKIIEVLKKEAGVTDPKLNAASLKAAREQISQPYVEMRSVGDLAPNKTIADVVRASAPEEITGAEAAVRGATRITNRLADRIEAGDFSGNSAVNHINYYRQNAKRLYNKTDASEADLAKARVYENSAKQLESLLEANITDPALLTAFRSARQQLAKNFTVDDIINNQSGIPDLSKLNSGKLANAPLEGDLAALRNIQANLPEVVAPVSKYGEVITHLSRTSPSGSAGAAVGLTMGQPTAGGLAGAVTGLLGGRLARSHVLSPSYQAANVMPKMTSLMSQIPERAPPPLSLAPVGEPMGTPTPQAPLYQGRGLLSLADETPAVRASVEPGMNFPLRQEVLQRPEIAAPTQAFIAEAVRLRNLIENAQGFWKTKYREQLTMLENEFGAGMRQLGIDNAIDALGLRRLYESGGKTKLPIQKTRGLLSGDE